MGIEASRSRKIEPQQPGAPVTTQPAMTLAPDADGVSAPIHASTHADGCKVEAVGGTPTVSDAGTRMTGAEMVIRALADQGVEHLFGYPGGAVLPIYDALSHQDQVRHILVRHEQGAVHAAEGYARSTGKVGCVLVTSGPGATNSVTGLTDALCDSIPLVCITGQVPTHMIGNDAFQECDTVGITRPCTKYNYLVKNIDDHRAGPATGRHVEGLVQHPRQVGDVLYQVIVLGAGTGDADRVAFLEGVVADHVGRHLPGDADERDRVAQGVGEAGDRISGAGPRRDQHAADLAGRTRVSLGRMHRTLLVTNQHVAHLILMKQRVVDRQHRAARIAEQMFDALVGKCPDHHLGTRHRGTGFRRHRSFASII